MASPLKTRRMSKKAPMPKKSLIAGNWKMNNTIGEAVVLAQELVNNMDKSWKKSVEVAVIPPFIDIKPVKNVFDFEHRKIAVGAQNVYYQPDGAFTGEISVRMLAEIGCKYCIVGHSERRTILGETNEDVNLKAKALMAGHIIPIVCVGESLAIRDDGKHVEFVLAQLRASLAGIDVTDPETLVIAYEPIWAIGTGRTATPEQAEEMCKAIRDELAAMYSEEIADKMYVLYGGSMNSGNADLLLSEENIDGGLIGGASLDAKKFIDIIDIAVKKYEAAAAQVIENYDPVLDEVIEPEA